MAYSTVRRQPTLLERFATDFGRRLKILVKLGTRCYGPAERRRLEIMNFTAYFVAGFTSIYTVQQVVRDFAFWQPVIFINLGLITVALAVPFLHRFSPIAGVMSLGVAEYVGLFLLTMFLGRDSGLLIQYVAAICVFFVVIPLERIRLIVGMAGLGLILHIAAWALFASDKAFLEASRTDLDMLYITAVATTFTIVSVVIYYAFKIAQTAQAQSDALLFNIFPGSIVDRLKEQPDGVIADVCVEGSVMFADLDGFVPIAKRLGPVKSVRLLGAITRAFDELVDQWGVEKIKTIGDSYMIAAGVPVAVSDHAERVARISLAMQKAIGQIAVDQGVQLSLRIGIASGPLLAGVIAAKRAAYDVWGDAVNLAARLEAASSPGRILISSQTKERLGPAFGFEPCGPLALKGFGVEDTWFVTQAA